MITFLEGGPHPEVYGEIYFKFRLRRSVGPQFGFVALLVDFEVGVVGFEELVDDFIDIFFHFPG